MSVDITVRSMDQSELPEMKEMVALDKKGVAIPLTATLVVQALVSLVAFAAPIFAPTAARDIGISATSVGIYIGLIYITSMFSSLWSGDFIGRYGALRVSQVCLLICGVGLALAAVGSVPVLILSALILGLGYGAVTPASSHILSRNAPASLMSFVFSIKQTGVPLGGAVAGAIVPALVVFAGWKNTAVIVGAICGLGAILAQPIRRGIDSDRQPARRISFQGVTGPLRLVVTHRPLLRLAIISFFYGSMQLCLITYLVIYLTKNIGMTLIAAGLTSLCGPDRRYRWEDCLGHHCRSFVKTAAGAGLDWNYDVAGGCRDSQLFVGLAAPGNLDQYYCVRRQRHRLERGLPGGGGAPGARRTGQCRHRWMSVLYFPGGGGGAACFCRGGHAHRQLFAGISAFRRLHVCLRIGGRFQRA